MSPVLTNEPTDPHAMSPATPDPLPYAYSTGNAFATFTKFSGKNYFTWRRNPCPMGGRRSRPRQPHASCVLQEPTPKLLSGWRMNSVTSSRQMIILTKLRQRSRAATAHSNLTSKKLLSTPNWLLHGATAKLRLPLGNLRNRLTAAGLTISAIQFYQHFTNSLGNWTLRCTSLLGGTQLLTELNGTEPFA